MIHAYASQPNMWRHTAPIVDGLRDRGHAVATWTSRPQYPWGDPATFRDFPAGDLVIVASWIDARRWLTSPVVYIEHGAGQTYQNPAQDTYAGAARLGHVVGFICPGEHVAARWRERYPQAVVESVGCPALDQHLTPDAARNREDQHDQQDEEQDCDHRRSVNVPGSRDADGGEGASNRRDGRPDDGLRVRGLPVVAVSSHWRCSVVPETMPATPLYAKELAELVASGTVKMVGHCHPRATDHMSRLWARLGVPFEPDPDEILRHADLLVIDNSSLAYEAAALDIPVLSLNAPAYRRDVEHGLRFWDYIPGLMCDLPKDFLADVAEALKDGPGLPYLRRRAADHVYAHRDGSSTARAVRMIESLS